MFEIETATGKTFDSDFVVTIPTPPRAYIRILGQDLADVASVFDKPEETINLRYGENALINFTRLVAIVNESGAIKVVLAKE